MLSNKMAHRPFQLRAASTVLVLAAAIVSAGCVATMQAPVTGALCKTTFVTFVGFGDGLADIEQNGQRLWEGRLVEYNPSTDISGGAEVCAHGNRELVLHAGSKTYRARLPDNQARSFVLIDFRSTEPAIQGHPFLLD